MKISNCCGADMKEYEDASICPNCKEHCEIEEFDFEGSEKEDLFKGETVIDMLIKDNGVGDTFKKGLVR